MGAWGYKIFQSDDALDIRDTYTEKIIVGVPDDEAERSIVEEFELERQPELWLPLALTEWKYGRLSETAKENALRAIPGEIAELGELWRPELVAKREKELLQAREKLLSEMPARKKPRMPPWAVKCPWKVGNVLQYRVDTYHEYAHLGSFYVMLLVRGITETPPYKIPCEFASVSLYNWHSKTPPCEQLDEILSQPIPLVDFHIRSDVLRPVLTLSSLCEKNWIRLLDIKRISETPLHGETVTPLPVTKGSARDDLFYIGVCRTFFPEIKSRTIG